MLRAISKKVFHFQSRLVRWINFDSMDKYAWEDGDKRYTIQAYDMDEHWQEFLPRMAKGYVTADLSGRYFPDVEKREEFFSLYYQYRYKTSFSDGRASFIGVKIHEVIDGVERSRLTYGGILMYDTLWRDVDASDLVNFDREMAKNILKRDQWLEENVHAPMRRVAEKMGNAPWFASYHAMDPEMRKPEMVTKYMTKGFKIGCQYGLQRHELLNQPPMKSEPEFYSLMVETPPRTDKFLKAMNYEIVAHLHHNHKKGCGCYQDHGVERNNLSCHFIIAPVTTAPSIRKALLELDSKPTE